MKQQKLSNIHQLGRSMIEMLGVLSIVGVLSVAGITGFNKAWRKHRVNQTVDIMTQIFSNYIEGKSKGVFTSLLSGDSLSSDDDDMLERLVASGIYDNCIFEIAPNEDKSCKLPIGNLTFWINNTTAEFHIFFYGGGQTQKCVDFTSFPWDTLLPNNAKFEVNGDYSGTLVGAGYFNGEAKEYTSSYSPTQAATACHLACDAREDDDDPCEIDITFQ